MTLLNKLLNPGPDVYYDPDFRIVFEDHLNYILNNRRTNISIVTIDDNTAARFAGDWRGLMLELPEVVVTPHMAWYNMRLNGWSYTTEYDGKQTSIAILDESYVEKLVAQYKTVKKK